MKKILITGGLGYIGGRLSKFLSENTDLYIKISTREKDIEKPSWLKNGEIVNLDLQDEESIKSVSGDVDYIIHLAALNEIDSAKCPEEAIIVSALGTYRLLKNNTKLKRVVYFSTAHVYGAPLCGYIDEKKITLPMHPYSYTHKFSEDIVLSNNKNNMVVRLSNSFGCPERVKINRWTLLVNDLCKQAVVNKKLILRSNGKDIRDFIPISDVCRAVLHLLNLDPKDERLKNIDNYIFNIGGDKTITVLDMTNLIASRTEKILGYTPEIIIGENGPTQSLDLEYSIQKLKDTGFSLQGSFEEEIDKTLIFCKEEFLNGTK